MELDLQPRACPTCAVHAGQVVYNAKLDLGALDGFAFASRKLPEYMHHRLVECRHCSLLYADPAPGPDALARLYHAAEFDSSEEAACASRSYARLLPEIKRRVGASGTAVDVGTGTGDFLGELLDHGFTDVRGIEPSSKPIAMALPRVRDRIIAGMFQADVFPRSSLGLVTCFQTMEHLSDPATFCREVFTLLRPGGALYLVIHDRRALSARVLKDRSPIFDIEHLQLFCRHSIEHLLREVGYSEVSIRPLWNRYPLRYWVRLVPIPSFLKRVFISLLSLPLLRRACLSIPAGNLTVVAYKAKDTR